LSLHYMIPVVSNEATTANTSVISGIERSGNQ
jgi:hypothetical protein